MKIKIGFFVIIGWCMALQATAQTTISGSFMHDGILRNYRAYIPAMYDPAISVPLLFNLHGYGSSNIEQELYGDFRPIADTAGFIIVHPNGTFDNLNNRFWNTFGSSTVDDIGFLSALIDTLGADYNIDQNRIYSTGMSNGGFMSYELASGLSDRIAAIASVAGSMVYSHFNSCNPLHPMPVLEIHGTADGTVPFEGNTLMVPIDTLLAFWVQYNHCSLIPTITPMPDIDPTDGCTAEHHVYEGGDSGSRVELFKIVGGAHTWPGSAYIIDVTNMDISASVEIWRFFRQYDLNGIVTGIEKETSQLPTFTIFPNPGHGNFTIEFDDNSEKQITVTNLLGQVVMQFACNSVKSDFSLENIGVYVIAVKSNDKIRTKRLIMN
ncbi:MAG: T9SS type A sorting domain-containing protein [Bacteroidales bacterium]|nr:T9SS type A sorting domain-containing protein [Bacteroidales bacterium]